MPRIRRGTEEEERPRGRLEQIKYDEQTLRQDAEGSRDEIFWAETREKKPRNWEEACLLPRIGTWSLGQGLLDCTLPGEPYGHSLGTNMDF